MKRHIYLLIFPLIFFISVQSFGQKMTRVEGKVISFETKEPLPFVNISFQNSNIGTVTDFDGEYILETKWATDKIQASFLGYEVSVKNLENKKKDQF